MPAWWAGTSPASSTASAAYQLVNWSNTSSPLLA
jgi:hypothetical protein